MFGVRFLDLDFIGVKRCFSTSSDEVMRVIRTVVSLKPKFTMQNQKVVHGPSTIVNRPVASDASRQVQRAASPFDGAEHASVAAGGRRHMGLWARRWARPGRGPSPGWGGRAR